ncbi:MAG: hypothetical protein B7Z10_01760 [Rhodobacterales bacterium 32-66-7]|nr:MAG: hypothetical protein B7Z31_03110 [Rhodobacterales bacterium 12-65-15]OYX26927.1 MAG: hypothetical protein B7Z10_01760 [Rhodobacterales bacterium 32-66-7]
MTLPLTLCLVWLIAANVIGMFPSRDYHWRAAYALIAIGVPLLVWVTWAGGLLVGGLVFAAAASILRWPVIFAWRRVRRIFGWP